MTKQLTGSKCALAFKCSFWMRDDVPVVDSFPGQAALEGTVLHSLIEANIRGVDGVDPMQHLLGDVESYQRVEKKYRQWIAWAQKERRVGWRPEVALAYDVQSDSARELDAQHHRDYSDAKPGEVCMQLDLVYMGEDAEGPYACIDDWKSGADSAYAAAQLGVGALAWCRLVGVDRARVRAVYIGEDAVEPKEAWLDVMNLDLVRAELVRVFRSPDTEPRPGPHCSTLYCPARTACPATIDDAAAIARVPVADMRTLIATSINTPEQAAHAHVRLRVIEDAVDAIKAQIREIVRAQGEVPLGNGKALKLVKVVTENFSKARIPPERADEVLRELRELGALASHERTHMKEVKAGGGAR